MENYQIAAKAEDKILKISALTTKKLTVQKDGFTYEQKTPVIHEFARYTHFSKDGSVHVTVIPHYQDWPAEGSDLDLSEKQKP